eukprot:3128816-Prymnesium_polylepis.1
MPELHRRGGKRVDARSLQTRLQDEPPELDAGGTPRPDELVVMQDAPLLVQSLKPQRACRDAALPGATAILLHRSLLAVHEQLDAAGAHAAVAKVAPALVRRAALVAASLVEKRYDHALGISAPRDAGPRARRRRFVNGRDLREAVVEEHSLLVAGHMR